MDGHFRVETDLDGVVTVWMDVAGKPVNAIGRGVLGELRAVIEGLEKGGAKGVIFASGKKRSFVAGADLNEVRDFSREETEAFLAEGQALFGRIAKLEVPTVAAINGDCLGGGLELALACRYRVMAEEAGVSVGLPEVKLGILPGWGGTVRLPGLVGLVRALPLLLTGKMLSARKALKAGVVDEVVRPEALLMAARRWVLGGGKTRRLRWREKVAGLSVVKRRILDRALVEVHKAGRGNYPSPGRIIEVLRVGVERGVEAQLEAERLGLMALRETEAGGNLLRLFFLKRDAKKWIGEQVHVKGAEVKRVGVIGGGTMGAGIVHGLIRAGIEVRLVEVSEGAAAAGLGRIRKALAEDVGAGRMTELEAHHVFNRVMPCTDWSGLGVCDLVVEAVVEEMGVKKEVFTKLDEVCRGDAVLCSNTSSLSVGEMGRGTKRPGRVVGMHFFNPVAKMPLVEVVRTAVSEEGALATVAGVCGRMEKTAILVGDGAGFLVNRILIPYLREALLVLEEGAGIREVDEAMKDWGMPMGPFELLDEIGLDVAEHVLVSLGGDAKRVKEMVGRGWLGKKSGRGFYVYGGKSGVVNGEMGARGGGAVGMDGGRVQWRLVLPMVNEAARVLEAGVVDRGEAVDLGSVLGLGLAPFRGGICRFADTEGLRVVVGKLEELRKEFGERFEVCGLLRELAASGGKLSEYRTGTAVAARALGAAGVTIKS